MRATEFIRGLLDLIDNLDGKDDNRLDFEDENISHPEEPTKLSNSPDTVIASIDMVTKDAGGGVNGPKHPADLKTATFPLYPNLQFKG